MTSLVNQGVRAGEAARLVLSEELTPVRSLRRADDIDEAAAKVDLVALPALLDDLLADLGTLAAWTDVLAPVLRRQGRRWQDGDAAFEAEWALTGAIAVALDRHSPRPSLRPAGAPVVLACSATERHMLPLQVLSTVLREAGIPVIFLGEMVPAVVVLRTALRLHPALVMIWSMTSFTADAALLAELARRDIPVRAVGPGWRTAGDRIGAVDNSLEGALRTVRAHVDSV